MPIAYATIYEDGFDEITTAPYFEKNINRKVYYLGRVDKTDYFDRHNGSTYFPSSKLDQYMRRNKINLIHINKPFFYEKEVKVDFSNSEFIRLTDQLYYLPF